MKTKICENCKSEITGRGSRFCSQSCNAKFHNMVRIKKVEKPCLNCNKLTTNDKFCKLECQQEYRKNKIFEEIENGNLSFDERQYKKYLIHINGEQCMKCGWNEIHPITGKVPIELEHIDGNSKNNSLENLKLLCPNCHSLTPTYKGLNKGNGRHKRMERYKNGMSY